MEIKPVDAAFDKREIAANILAALPDWFGIPESTAEYVDKSGELPFFAAFCENTPVGFLTLKETSAYAAEIYVMGVLPAFHRQGIGKGLYWAVRSWCVQKGYEYLQVKTLDASNPDIFYQKTRRFYESVGFRPLECIPQLWDAANPCLVMIQSLDENK